MTAQATATAILRAAQTQNWQEADARIFQITRQFVSQRDWNGLETHYDEMLYLTTSPSEYQHARIQNLDFFTDTLAATLQQAIQQAQQDGSIVALYFEYFFDNSECCSGDFFLCRSYSTDHDSWTTDFAAMVSGPCVFNYFNYDTEIEFTPLSRYLADN